jgi:hypothetical protein
VIVVDGATHSQKDGVKGNGGCLKDGSEVFMIFLRPVVLTVLDIDEVNVTLENAEIFGSVLSGEGGPVGGGWRCCRSAISLNCPLATPNPPPALLVCWIFLFPVRWKQPVQDPDSWRLTY